MREYMCYVMTMTSSRYVTRTQGYSVVYIMYTYYYVDIVVHVVKCTHVLTYARSVYTMCT